MPENHETVRKTILELVKKRGPGKTICPSDAARLLASEEREWRALMPQVREVADKLAQAGEIIVTQKGKQVDIVQAKGPVRLGLKT
ncbi:MAG: DUF3253 domain-containing protein [Pseudomonadota bacterium]